MSPDHIDYTKPFMENVKGQLKARFRLDPEGRPQFTEHKGLRHYTIDVFLTTKRTKEIKCVHYYMDDPSYIDPNGYSDDADNEFREEISSYGDVEILVTVEMGSKEKYEQRAWLSKMLENGHASDVDMGTPKSRAIRAALQRIRAN
jgi:hypothetical protein